MQAYAKIPGGRGFKSRPVQLLWMRSVYRAWDSGCQFTNIGPLVSRIILDGVTASESRRCKPKGEHAKFEDG